MTKQRIDEIRKELEGRRPDQQLGAIFRGWEGFLEFLTVAELLELLEEYEATHDENGVFIYS